MMNNVGFSCKEEFVVCISITRRRRMICRLFFFIIKRWAMLLPMIIMTMWALLSTGGLMV